MRLLRSFPLALGLLVSPPLIYAQAKIDVLNLTFTTIDVPGAGLTVVSGINTADDMVGWYGQSGSAPGSGFLLSAQNFTSFDYPGGSSTLAFRVNDSGLIAGTAYLFQNTAAVGFLYDGTTFTKVRIGSHTYTYVEGIDNAGDIVGGYGDFGGNQGYERAGTKFKNVTPPGSYMLVYATAINNLGQIAGTADEGAFFYSKGKYQTIAFPGASQTYAYGINDNAIVVGFYLRCAPSCADHGFALMKGKYLSFDYPGAMETYAYGINNAGKIVGSYTFDQQTFHGFVTNPITAADFQ